MSIMIRALSMFFVKIQHVKIEHEILSSVYLYVYLKTNFANNLRICTGYWYSVCIQHADSLGQALLDNINFDFLVTLTWIHGCLCQGSSVSQTQVALSLPAL